MHNINYLRDNLHNPAGQRLYFFSLPYLPPSSVISSSSVKFITRSLLIALSRLSWVEGDPRAPVPASTGDPGLRVKTAGLLDRRAEKSGDRGVGVEEPDEEVDCGAESRLDEIDPASCRPWTG